jgi:penicillin-binding protein 1A
LFFYYVSSTPKLDESRLQSPASSLLYDDKGEVFLDLGKEKRQLVDQDQIPLQLVQAITSIEDHRFFNHRGIDPIRIASSVIHNTSSDTTQGGSTLTQQLIKLSFFSTKESDQTLKRKAQEAWMAVQLERTHTKAEIMTLYVNKVYMANGYYGMRTAALAYFGKELKDLSLAQTALIAGLPQAPNYYDPYVNPEYAKTRRDTVLSQMKRYGYITDQQYKEAVAVPVQQDLLPPQTSSTVPKYLDNFVKQVIAEVKETTGKDVFTTGMKVYTTVNLEAQKRLYDIVNTNDYIQFPDDELQVATTVTDVNSGAVVAQIGGRKGDENVTFGTNQAVQTNRDFGSTMKPLTDYGPALEYDAPAAYGYNKTYNSTGTVILDEPYQYPNTDIDVNNWDGKYLGAITLRYALVQSRNVPAVKTLDAVGLQKSKDFLAGLGINYPQLEFSNAISSSTSQTGNQYGASSEKMAAAYGAIANGGTYIAPYYVTKIVYEDGSQAKELTHKKTRAMKETTAYMLTDVLKGVIPNGGAYNADSDAVYEASKTGTSNYSDDEYEKAMEGIASWQTEGQSVGPDKNFVGFTTDYSIATWTGYKNRLTPMYGDKIYIAQRVYKNMMNYLVSKKANSDWTMPKGLYTTYSGELVVGDEEEEKQYQNDQAAYVSRSQAAAWAAAQASSEAAAAAASSESDTTSSETGDANATENTGDVGTDTADSTTESTPTADNTETPENATDTAASSEADTATQ